MCWYVVVVRVTSIPPVRARNLGEVDELIEAGWAWNSDDAMRTVEALLQRGCPNNYDVNGMSAVLTVSRSTVALSYSNTFCKQAGLRAHVLLRALLKATTPSKLNDVMATSKIPSRRSSAPHARPARALAAPPLDALARST